MSFKILRVTLKDKKYLANKYIIQGELFMKQAIYKVTSAKTKINEFSKRFICFLILTAVLISSLLIFPLTVSAAPAQPTGTAQQRIDQLLKLYPNGSYFTFNGKACTHGRYSTCSNCNLKNIMTNKHGYSQSQFNGLYDGWTCVAFARFSFYYLWGVKYNGGSAPSGTREVGINQAKLGDLVTFNNHWGIFVKADSNYVYLYDANGSGGIGQVFYNVNKFSRSSVVRIIQANSNTDTTSSPPAQTTQKSYTIQASSGANVRNTAAGTQIVGAIARGSIVRYTETKVANGYTWMLIESGSTFASGSWGKTIGYWVAMV